LDWFGIIWLSESRSCDQPSKRAGTRDTDRTLYLRGLLRLPEGRSMVFHARAFQGPLEKNGAARFSCGLLEQAGMERPALQRGIYAETRYICKSLGPGPCLHTHVRAERPGVPRRV